MPLSQSQLTKLGDRLRVAVTEADLMLLDEYRRSYSEPGKWVAKEVELCTGFVPTQRNAKSSRAIVEKLLRQSSRLGRIQDIAGCRLTVPNRRVQSAVVEQLSVHFPDAEVKDRREHPSHGYRAVHVIVRREGLLIEVQVRTALQHLWGQLSEQLADRFGNEVKYGAGPSEVIELLRESSEVISDVEVAEVDLERLELLMGQAQLPSEEVRDLLIQIRKKFDSANEMLRTLLNGTVADRLMAG
ncbi:hypothetical protein CDL60_15585 [Roseateles noduli]|nr:hypothetical protein CDL60_15585 [Roseateles noduli]